LSGVDAMGDIAAIQASLANIISRATA